MRINEKNKYIYYIKMKIRAWSVTVYYSNINNKLSSNPIKPTATKI